MKAAIALIFFLSVGSVSHSQDKPKHEEDNCCCSTYETNVCLTKVIKKLDIELNDANAKVLKLSAQSDKLRAAQRLWLRYRDAECDAEALQYEGGSIAGQIGGYCITRLTRQRIDDLNALVQQYSR